MGAAAVPAFAVGDLVQAAPVLDERITLGFRHDASHLAARKANAMGTVQSFELARVQTGKRPPPLVYFVQHEEYGSFAAYLADEIVPGVAPPRPPRLEEGSDNRGPFLNLDNTGNVEGGHPCQLCAEVLFPDGIPYDGRGDVVERAIVGQELCAPCLALVRSLMRAMRFFPLCSGTQMAKLRPAMDPVRICLGMEYLGCRGVLVSDQRLTVLPPVGQREAFRMARTWGLREGARRDGGWKGTQCKAAWTWGGTWLRLRCTRCDVSLRYSRGCNTPGFHYATLGAWGDWMQHLLLGPAKKSRCRPALLQSRK